MRVLADGRTKFALLTTAPNLPSKPTADELNAGIDLSFKVLQDNFSFGATDSDKVAEKALGDINNSNALAASNFQCAWTIWRQFAEDAPGFDAVEDAGFQAVKVKGATIYLYARKTEKLATLPFADGDELYLGMEAVNDEPQDVTGGGFIKFAIPCEPQDAWPFITVGPPPAWQANHTYAVNAEVALTGGEVLKATVGGDSGATEPVAPASVGGTVTDGTVTWQRVS